MPPPLIAFKTFGCACYLYLRPYNKYKLQPRSVECVSRISSFVQGNLCLDLSINTVYTACYALFNEDVFPFANKFDLITSHVPFSTAILDSKWFPNTSASTSSSYSTLASSSSTLLFLILHLIVFFWIFFILLLLFPVFLIHLFNLHLLIQLHCCLLPFLMLILVYLLLLLHIPLIFLFMWIHTPCSPNLNLVYTSLKFFKSPLITHIRSPHPLLWLQNILNGLLLWIQNFTHSLDNRPGHLFLHLLIKI